MLFRFASYDVFFSWACFVLVPNTKYNHVEVGSTCNLASVNVVPLVKLPMNSRQDASTVQLEQFVVSMVNLNQDVLTSPTPSFHALRFGSMLSLEGVKLAPPVKLLMNSKQGALGMKRKEFILTQAAYIDKMFPLQMEHWSGRFLEKLCSVTRTVKTCTKPKQSLKLGLGGTNSFIEATKTAPAISTAANYVITKLAYLITNSHLIDQHAHASGMPEWRVTITLVARTTNVSASTALKEMARYVAI